LRLELLKPAGGDVLYTIPVPDVAFQQVNWRFSPNSESLAAWYTKGPQSDPDISDRAQTVDLWDVPPR
jgi:hypothetical protein